MKKYVKAQVIAKNLPSGSYAAGCPANGQWSDYCFLKSTKKYCKDCERAN